MIIKIDTNSEVEEVHKRVLDKFVELGYKPISGHEL